MRDPSDASPRPPAHWLVRPATIRRLWVAFALVLAGLTAADLWVEGHPHFGVDGTFGFYSWYGLATCMAMVLVAKGLGFFLKRRDTYYDDRA